MNTREALGLIEVNALDPSTDQRGVIADIAHAALAALIEEEETMANKGQRLPKYSDAHVVSIGIDGTSLVIANSDGWGTKEFVLCECRSGDDAELIARLVNRRAGRSGR